MFRSSLLAICALALAACNQAGDRAPAHASQSPGTRIGETQQAQISDEARTQFETNIRDQLAMASAQFAPGSIPIPGLEDALLTMQPGNDHQFPVNLVSGKKYSFIGVCDTDCTNVDLELLNGTTGEVVGADLLDDDVPIVHYTPTANARFFVRLILRNCTQAPCYVGGRGLQAPG